MGISYGSALAGAAAMASVSKTANYTAAVNDFVVVDATSGPITITLPSAPAANSKVAVKKGDSSTNLVTVVPAGAATINGDTAVGLGTVGASATVLFDGTDWQLLAMYAPNSVSPSSFLPTGGTSGQLLTKNTSTNYDASWAAPVVPATGTPFIPWTTGRTFIQPAGHSYSTGASMPSATVTAFPIRVPNACTLDSISLNVTSTTGSATCQLSLYADTAASGGYSHPGVRLATNSITVSGTGLATWPLSYTFTSAMTIWVVYSNSLTTSFSGTTAALTQHNWILGGPTQLTSQYNQMYFSGATTHSSDFTAQSFAGQSGLVPLFMFTIA